MARFAVVDGNESQPARPQPDWEQHSGSPTEPPSPEAAAPPNEHAQPGHPDAPPDIPDTKSARPEVPSPVGTTPSPPPPAPDAGNGPVAPAHASPNGHTTQPAPPPPPTQPSSPIPAYGTPAHLAPARPGDEDDTPRAASIPFSPRHLRQGPSRDDGADRGRVQAIKDLITPRNLALFVPAVIVALLGLVIVSWAVDNARHSDQVQRNVNVAGYAVGGATEETLAATVASVADEIGARPVTVVVDGTEIDTIAAGDLGLVMDEQGAIDAAMDVGRDGSLLTRPFEWLGSMVRDREIAPDYTVSETQLSGTLQLAYDESISETDTVVQARNPSVGLVDGEFSIEPGQAGTGLDMDLASDDLLAAAEGSNDPFGRLELAIETSEIAPDIGDDEAQSLADDLNNLTASGMTLDAGDAAGIDESLTPEQLRAWITPVLGSEEAVALEHLSPEEIEALAPIDWVADYGATETAVTEVFSDLSAEPVDAEPVLSGGTVEVTESEAGVTCCGENIGQRVWEALEAGETTVEVDAEVVEPEYTTEEVEGWGVKEPIGGSRGWRSGQEVSGPRPGYTTWEVGEGGRAHNIGRMADDVNGAWIAPGATWSINDHVGARTCPPYQEGGAIVDGELVSDDCGGGTSQFATTTLNAAYFAGLDVTGRPHSVYFNRYPPGREATMGAPGTGLNVTITNNTEYGVLIQAARHGQEVTVTIWSTPSIEVRDLGTEEGENGNCRVVTNTRERTFPDGSTRTDAFRAEYKPEPGESC